MGIEDATVLADALLNNPPVLDDQGLNFQLALKEYAQRRVVRSRKLIPLASWSASSLAPGPLMRWLRNILLRIPVRDQKLYVSTLMR